MTTTVEQSISVAVPVRTAYDQWTQFEEFPSFMGGVEEVRQLDDRRLHWVAEIAGVRREWEATVLEQVPDSTIAWAATSGATNAGAVRFEPTGPGTTTVYLSLEYDPEGLVEQAGDLLGLVERQVRSDLQRFKALVEDQGYASGAWRGSVAGSGVGTPRVGAVAASQGDSGKAGLSTKAVLAGAAVAAGGLAAAGALVGRSGGDAEPEEPVEPGPSAPTTALTATTEPTTALTPTTEPTTTEAPTALPAPDVPVVAPPTDTVAVPAAPVFVPSPGTPDLLDPPVIAPESDAPEDPSSADGR